jgi:hypothetical protein
MTTSRTDTAMDDANEPAITPDHGRDRALAAARVAEETRGTDVGKGSVAYLLPPYEEIHRIGNTTGKPTVSLHIYGRDLDEINVFDQATGKVSPMRIKYYSTDCGEHPFVI